MARVEGWGRNRQRNRACVAYHEIELLEGPNRLVLDRLQPTRAQRLAEPSRKHWIFGGLHGDGPFGQSDDSDGGEREGLACP